jgi:hypothetical protein
LFRLRSLAVGNLVMLLMGVTMNSAFFFISLYLQQVIGYSPLRSGMAMVPVTFVTESAFAAGWNTPWIWASRPPHDIHAALCAAVIFASGAVLVTVRGDRGWIARSEHRG